MTQTNQRWDSCSLFNITSVLNLPLASPLVQKPDGQSASQEELQTSELEAQAPVETRPDAAIESVGKKRKAPASKTEGDAVTKKKATLPAVIKGNRPSAQGQLSSSHGPTWYIIPAARVTQMILGSFKSPSDLGRLARACKRFHPFAMQVLHKRVTVAVSYLAHIMKLFRALEPYLTIAQKKQLKK
ncbi:hypothetical protein ACJZ2D_016053 [Fusarium nematophilum]